MRAVEVLAELADEGVQLALRNGQLCIRPRGRARPELLALVRENAAHLRALLSQYEEPGRAEAVLEAYEERAAIMEFDGGLSRAEAEAQAAAAHLTARASPEARRWRGERLDLGDLRPCLWCRNLTRSGRCLAAWRRELRAARDYEPTFPDQPRRCIGYSPPDDDPDQRPGCERWPEMVEWQGPQDAV